jgi:hypothetical protein
MRAALDLLNNPILSIRLAKFKATDADLFRAPQQDGG